MNATIQHSLSLNLKEKFLSALRAFAQNAPRISRNDPWLIERTFRENGLTCKAVWDKR